MKKYVKYVFLLLSLSVVCGNDSLLTRGYSVDYPDGASNPVMLYGAQNDVYFCYISQGKIFFKKRCEETFSYEDYNFDTGHREFSDVISLHRFEKDGGDLLFFINREGADDRVYFLGFNSEGVFTLYNPEPVASGSGVIKNFNVNTIRGSQLVFTYLQNGALHYALYTQDNLFTPVDPVSGIISDNSVQDFRIGGTFLQSDFILAGYFTEKIDENSFHINYFHLKEGKPEVINLDIVSRYEKGDISYTLEDLYHPVISYKNSGIFKKYKLVNLEIFTTSVQLPAAEDFRVILSPKYNMYFLTDSGSLYKDEELISEDVMSDPIFWDENTLIYINNENKLIIYNLLTREGVPVPLEGEVKGIISREYYHVAFWTQGKQSFYGFFSQDGVYLVQEDHSDLYAKLKAGHLDMEVFFYYYTEGVELPPVDKLICLNYNKYLVISQESSSVYEIEGGAE